MDNSNDNYDHKDDDNHNKDDGNGGGREEYKNGVSFVDKLFNINYYNKLFKFTL
jgi:hypothetical protein